MKNMMDYYGYHMWWHGYSWNILSWLLIIGGIIALALLINDARQRHEHTDQTNSAISILKERYAKGEIGKQEFEEKKHDLLH